MTIDKRTFQFTVAALWALAIVSVVMFFAAPARAEDPMPPIKCFVGASAGTGAMATKVDSVVRIDVGGTAPLLSGEVGCKINSGTIATLGILRADLQRLGGSLDTATIQSNARYMGILAAALAINANTDVYLGPALVMSKFSIKDWQSTNVTGYGAVAGIETTLFATGLKGFLEYNYLAYRSYDATGATVKPSESVVRAGVRFGF